MTFFRLQQKKKMDSNNITEKKIKNIYDFGTMPSKKTICDKMQLFVIEEGNYFDKIFYSIFLFTSFEKLIK